MRVIFKNHTCDTVSSNTESKMKLWFDTESLVKLMYGDLQARQVSSSKNESTFNNKLYVVFLFRLRVLHGNTHEWTHYSPFHLPFAIHTECLWKWKKTEMNKWNCFLYSFFNDYLFWIQSNTINAFCTVGSIDWPFSIIKKQCRLHVCCHHI